MIAGNISKTTGWVIAYGIPGNFHEASFSSNFLRCCSLCELHCLCSGYGIRQGNGRSLFGGGAVRRQRRSVLSCRALFGGGGGPRGRCCGVSGGFPARPPRPPP